MFLFVCPSKSEAFSNAFYVLIFCVWMRVCVCPSIVFKHVSHLAFDNRTKGENLEGEGGALFRSGNSFCRNKWVWIISSPFVSDKQYNDNNNNNNYTKEEN